MDNDVRSLEDKFFMITTCIFHQAGEFEMMEDGNGTMMDYQVF